MTSMKRTRILLFLAALAVFGGPTLISGDKLSPEQEYGYQSNHKNIDTEDTTGDRRLAKSSSADGFKAKGTKADSRKYEDIEDDYEEGRAGKGSKSSSKGSKGRRAVLR